MHVTRPVQRTRSSRIYIIQCETRREPTKLSVRAARFLSFVFPRNAKNDHFWEKNSSEKEAPTLVLNDLSALSGLRLWETAKRPKSQSETGK